MEEREKTSQKETVKECKVIPGPRGWPVIGNLTQLDTKSLQMTFYNWKLQYGPVFQFSMMGHKFAILNDADMFKAVFENDSVQNRPEHSFYKTFNFNGHGMTFTNFREQERIVKEICRKILHEVYNDEHLKKLKAKELECLVQRLSTGEDVDLGAVLLSSVARQFTIEIMGIEPTDSQLSAALEYLNAIIELFLEGREFLLTMLPWIRYIPGSTRNAVLRITNAKECLVKELLNTAKSNYVEGEEHGLIHRFLREQKHFNNKAGLNVVEDEQVAACCTTEIIGGGFVGTTENLMHCFLVLLHHPQIYENLKGEIEKVSSGKSAGEVLLENVTYTNAFVMECVRYASIVHVTLPHAVEADINIAGYKFEKGMTVLGSTWNLHHDERIWGDPWTIRPERFLDDDGNIHPPSYATFSAFMPFGTGSRYCKGNDLAMSKILQTLTYVLVHCELSQAKNTIKLPENDPRKYRSLVALGVPNFRCRFTRKQ